MNASVALLAGLLSLLVSGGDHPASDETSRAVRSPFRVHARGVDRETLDVLREDLRHAEKRITRALGPFPDTVSVRVFVDRASFSAALRERWGIPRTACWMVGAADDHALFLLSPGAWEQEACEHDPGDPGHRRRLVTHEAIHAYHGQVNPSRDIGLLEGIGWFVEGLAIHLSGQLGAEHAGRAARAIEEEAGPEGLADAWSGPYRYGVTGSMVAFVEAGWGRAVLERLLAATSTEEILSRLGCDETRFMASWRGWVSRSRSPDGSLDRRPCSPTRSPAPVRARPAFRNRGASHSRRPGQKERAKLRGASRSNYIRSVSSVG